MRQQKVKENEQGVHILKQSCCFRVNLLVEEGTKLEDLCLLLLVKRTRRAFLLSCKVPWLLANLTRLCSILLLNTCVVVIKKPWLDLLFPTHLETC